MRMRCLNVVLGHRLGLPLRATPNVPLRPDSQTSRELALGRLLLPALRRAISLVYPTAKSGHSRNQVIQGWQRAGGAVKRKLAAVFLTQLTRSPVIRRSTQAGISNQVDHHTPSDCDRQLKALQAQLRELTAPGAAAADLSAIRTRRAELSNEISRAEKALAGTSRPSPAITSPSFAPPADAGPKPLPPGTSGAGRKVAVHACRRR